MGKAIFNVSVLFIIALISCTSAPMMSEAPASGFSERYRSEISRSDSSENINQERMITYTASIELSVKNPDETRERLSEQVAENNGFITRVTENTVVARIPSENMDNYLVHARTLGTIVNETISGNDITDQYRDNVIRLDNLRNIRNRYLALLDKADTVSDILSIEKELERINTEIDIMEGRIRHAELSVTYSNITIRFREKAKPGPVGWIFYGLYRGVKWLFVWN